MVRKVTLGIFIAIFVIFLMSHNASAITGVFDIDNYSIDYFTNNSSIKCNYDGTWPTSYSYFCQLQGNRTTLQGIEFPARNYNKGDIIQFDIITSYDGSSFTTGQSASGYYINPYSLPMVMDYNIIDSLDVEQLYANDRSRLINYYIQYVCNSSGTGETCSSYPELSQSDINLQAFRFTFRVTRDAIALPLQVTGRANVLFNLVGYNIGSNYSRLYPVRFHVYRLGETRENKEVEEKTQEAVDQSTSDGNSSKNTVESSTQSLMSAGGSIISALVNAPATDCNISVQTTGNSRLFTTAIGQLNLCSDVPQGVLAMVQGIVALVFTPIVLYFTYNVLTTLYNQFKEYNS